MMDVKISKDKHFGDGLIERTSFMLDEIEKKLYKDEKDHDHDQGRRKDTK